MAVKSIASTKNETIKRIQKLSQKAKLRYEEGVYVLEGKKQVLELAPEHIRMLIVREDQWPFYEMHYGDVLHQMEVVILSASVYKHISMDTTSQGIMALVAINHVRLTSDGIKEKGLYLMCESIQDPGNMGTLIRVADAVQADGVIVNRTSVDPYHPKVVKSSMGSIEHVPVYIEEELTDAVQRLQSRGISVYGAYLDESYPYDAPNYSKGTCFIIGNEGNGITNTLIQATDYRVHIPMPGQSESLNASVAGGVLLYEALRQRRLGKTD